MLDTTSGNLRVSRGGLLGPGTRASDIHGLAAATPSAGSSGDLDPIVLEMDERSWVVTFDGVDGEFLLTVACLNEWLSSIEIQYAGVVPRDRKSAVELYRKRHNELLKRWAVVVPASFSWGAVLLEESELPDDEDADEPSDLIRIDYTRVPKEVLPARRVSVWSGYLATGTALVGLGLLAWCLWLQPPPAEMDIVPVLDLPWLLGLIVVGLSCGLLLADRFCRQAAPWNKGEQWRWPCPGCQRRSWHRPTSLRKVGCPPAPGDWPDWYQCEKCGAFFHEDAMSYHPCLMAQTPPYEETWRRWPELSGSDMPERFRSPASAPKDAAELEAELKPFVKALEAGLSEGVGCLPWLVAFLVPGWAFFLCRAALAGHWVSGGVALLAFVAACVLVTEFEKRVQRHHWREGYVRQVLHFLERVGMSKDEFRQRVKEIAGKNSALLRFLEAEGPAANRSHR